MVDSPFRALRLILNAPAAHARPCSFCGMGRGHADSCELAAGTLFLKRWDEKQIPAERMRSAVEREIDHRNGF